MSRIINFNEAILEATDEILTNHCNCIVVGLGVPDPKGIFGTTLGLTEKFGSNRVYDMPTAENAMTGIAIGAAINGIRPIMTHQRVEFSLLGIEQLINQAAKWHYMTGGKSSVPLVIRLIVGRGWGQGPQHSQFLDPIFAHVPGLKVVCPSSAYEAKGLLWSAFKDDNPVIFFEHRWLHSTKSIVPDTPYSLPIGKCNIVEEGTDFTLVSYSYGLTDCRKIAKILKSFDIHPEIVDVRSLRPIDHQTIIESVKKTGRLLCIDNGWSHMNVAAEIISNVVTESFDSLKCAPQRIGIVDVPIPSTRSLANLVYPSLKDIAHKIETIMERKIFPNHFSFPENQDVPDQSFTGPF